MLSNNLNLFFTIVGASVTAFLGVLVFFHDHKSLINRIFIIHSIVGVVWAIVNYISLLVPPGRALFWIRLVVFFAVPHVFLFFLFVKNFPTSVLAMKRKWFYAVISIMAVMMLLVLSPFVFSGIEIVDRNVVPTPGMLMPFFAPTLILFFFLSFILVIRRYLRSENLIKRQWLAIGIGLVLAYSLLIFFVFVRVILFNDTTYVLYSPLFILPIFIGAAVAILRHHLFNMKVIATEIIAFLILVGSFVQIVIAQTDFARGLAVGVTVFTLYFGVLLIRSVLKEVEQREQLQKLTEELKTANIKLEDLSRFKTQLLSLASHQVKAPLAAIKGFAQILTEGLYGAVNGKIKEALGKIKFSADELIELINDLLDLRKVEEGKMEYQFAKTDLIKMINEVIDALRPLAGQKQLELSFTTDFKEVFVNADGTKLRQVIQNLVDNAIKYTPQGFVKIELQEDAKDKNGISVIISDSGVGIPADLIPHLFEEFIRDERIKREIRGTGLGLFIARKIIEAHGGSISVQSEGENKGSRFEMRLRRV